VWVHAVSLGEVIAASPLIDAMLDKQWSVLVTTMTPTGSERVTARFGDKVAHQYVPYDLPGVLKRFFRQVKPRIGVIMETELWPNLIYQAKSAGVPLILANARLSASSLKAYIKLGWLFKPILNQFTNIMAQSEDDARHYRTLGAKPELIQVLGNMKFDVPTNQIDGALFADLKMHWGQKRVVVLAASTHDDEESQILGQLKRLQKAIPDVLLIIAPRHPERFKTVYQAALNAGFRSGLRSDLSLVSIDTEVVVVDSLGELLGFFHVCDYAFVGGSLVPVGGHNVLEPVAMQVPVLSGSHVHNFKSICADLVESQALQLVQTPEELIDALIYLHNNKDICSQRVSNATAVLERNKGSVGRHMQYIEQLI
jgi:3-deoxy-D-manno-octulosonic-acid transferase